MGKAGLNGAGTVLVTGASTGIGAACAARLEAHGFKVFAGVRKPEDGERLQREFSPELVPVILDVTDHASVHRAAGEVAEACGDSGLRGLVNNAGIGVGGPLECVALEAMRLQLEVNVIGAVAVTQACLPMLRKARGRIVNMSSISGRIAFPFMGPYCASKFALEALNDALRMELSPWGIQVISVQPGRIRTPIWQKSSAAVRDAMEKLPGPMKELYANELPAIAKSVRKAETMGIPADRVALAVLHALTASRPKARYLVGLDARAAGFLRRVLPTRLGDKLLRRGIAGGG